MTPDTIRKTTMIDENDTHTADLLRTVTTELESDKAARTEFTVAGFGTGTVAELEMYLDQIKGERDHLAALANSPTTLAALALYDAVGLATNTAMADLIDTVEEQTDDIRDLMATVEEQADDIRVLRADLEDLEDQMTPSPTAPLSGQRSRTAWTRPPPKRPGR
jgi:predicted aconitase